MKQEERVFLPDGFANKFSACRNKFFGLMCC
jgi:hypothetical protein